MAWSTSYIVPSTLVAGLTTLAPPAVPSLAESGSGGSMSAGTYGVEVTYVNSYGETTASSSSSQAISGAGELVITSPVAEGNATGWYAYVTVANGGTYYRQQTPGSPTAIATNLTLLANPTTGGANPPGGNTSQLALDLGTNNGSTMYCALYSNSVTPAVDTDPQYYNAAPWNTGEVTGTNWPSGGVTLALAGYGLSHQAGGYMQFSAANLSVINTTISTGVYGCLIYAGGLSNFPAICAVFFGGSGYTTSVGTFGITWPTGGIWTVELAP